MTVDTIKLFYEERIEIRPLPAVERNATDHDRICTLQYSVLPAVKP
jgi:hypothetical protein